MPHKSIERFAGRSTCLIVDPCSFQKERERGREGEGDIKYHGKRERCHAMAEEASSCRFGNSFGIRD